MEYIPELDSKGDCTVLWIYIKTATCSCILEPDLQHGFYLNWKKNHFNSTCLVIHILYCIETCYGEYSQLSILLWVGHYVSSHLPQACDWFPCMSLCVWWCPQGAYWEVQVWAAGLGAYCGVWVWNAGSGVYWGAQVWGAGLGTCCGAWVWDVGSGVYCGAWVWVAAYFGAGMWEWCSFCIFCFTALLSRTPLWAEGDQAEK